MHTGDEFIQLYEACVLELYYDHCHDTWVDFLLKNAAWMTCSTARIWTVISRTCLGIFSYLCAELCYHLFTWADRSYTYLTTDCHKEGDCCKFIYSQAIELTVSLNLYTLAHEYTDIALHVLTHTSMWAQACVLSAHSLICIFNFTTIIFLVMLASDSNGLFSSLLTYSWIPFMASE